MNISELTQNKPVAARTDGSGDVAQRNKPPGLNSQHSEASQATQDENSFAPLDKVQAVVDEVQEQFNANDINLKFKVLEESGGVQVEVRDSEGKTIRKIPGDDLIKLSRSLKNLDSGFLNQAS